jgi:glycosyltransferase involved in cell wall biosynthesis
MVIDSRSAQLTRMTSANIQVLYISYNGMLQPLGQSQVIPYLKGLAAQGYDFTLLSFEREEAYSEAGRKLCAQLKQELAQANIDWHWLKYHQRPSLPATAYDVWAGVRYCKRIARLRSFELVHARSHIPATIALELKKHTGAKMIFDIRGLMADEYVDAGHWRKGSTAYRITKKFEKAAMGHADGIVTLTKRIWPIIKEWDGLRGHAVTHEVIPCCADLQRFSFSSQARAERRRTLEVNDRFVFVYSGSIDGWYLTEAMVDFFSVIVRKRPDAFFLWLTQASRERLQGLMRSRGIGATDYKIVSSPPSDVPAYLAASDVGLAFIKPCFSKLASSPTKYAEYLGCGLPLVINAGIGDSDALVNEYHAGILINGGNEDYLPALDGLKPFTDEPEQTRKRMHGIAEQLFDLESVGIATYARLYHEVLGPTERTARRR